MLDQISDETSALNICGTKFQMISSLFVWFVALSPKSTAMDMAGWSVHLTTLLLLGKLEQAVNQYCVQIVSLVTDKNPS